MHSSVLTKFSFVTKTNSIPMVRPIIFWNKLGMSLSTVMFGLNFSWKYYLYHKSLHSIPSDLLTLVCKFCWISHAKLSSGCFPLRNKWILSNFSPEFNCKHIFGNMVKMNLYTLVPVNPLSSLYLFSKNTFTKHCSNILWYCFISQLFKKRNLRSWDKDNCI